MKNLKFIFLFMLVNLVITQVNSMETDSNSHPTQQVMDKNAPVQPEVFKLNPGCWEVFKLWLKDHWCNDNRCCYCGFQDYEFCDTQSDCQKYNSDDEL